MTEPVAAYVEPGHVDRGRRARRKLANGVFIVACVFATALALLVLVAILASLVQQGVGGLNGAVFTQSTPAPGSPGGLANAITGSIMLCAGAMAIAVVVGVLAGTWLSEFARDTSCPVGSAESRVWSMRRRWSCRALRRSNWTLSATRPP